MFLALNSNLPSVFAREKIDKMPQIKKITFIFNYMLHTNDFDQLNLNYNNNFQIVIMTMTIFYLVLISEIFNCKNQIVVNLAAKHDKTTIYNSQLVFRLHLGTFKLTIVFNSNGANDYF